MAGTCRSTSPVTSACGLRSCPARRTLQGVALGHPTRLAWPPTRPAASDHPPPVGQATAHPPGGDRRVERLRVETPADPAQHVLVLLVVLVPDSLQELLVAPGAAHVLGRAGPCAFEADRITLAPLGTQAALEEDLVPPAIPEVVLVLEPEALAAFREHGADLRGRGVAVVELHEVLVQQQGVAVVLAPDLEVVQVGVRPAHRRLDVFVQLVQRAVLDLEAPPDG